MSFTNQPSPEDQDQPLSDEDVVAQFIITCDSDGSLSFYYDWKRDEAGITGMASVLAALGEKLLPTGVINDMKSQSSSPEELQMMEKIETLSSAISNIKNSNQTDDDNQDEVVIDPTTATSLM